MHLPTSAPTCHANSVPRGYCSPPYVCKQTPKVVAVAHGQSPHERVQNGVFPPHISDFLLPPFIPLVQPSTSSSGPLLHAVYFSTRPASSQINSPLRLLSNQFAPTFHCRIWLRSRFVCVLLSPLLSTSSASLANVATADRLPTGAVFCAKPTYIRPYTLALATMRYVVLAAAALCSLPVFTQAADNDWHIGCEASGKCSYYQGDKAESGHAARRRDLSDIIDREDVDPIPDFEYFDTRCKPDNKDDIIERFNGTHWVDFFTCFPAGSCSDLQGHGSCNTKPNVWVVPGKFLLTTFECDEGGVRGTCTQTGTTVPLLLPPTSYKRDSLGVSSVASLADSLVDNGSHPKQAYPVPTRCNPTSHSGILQYWHVGQRNWRDFYYCGLREECIDVIPMDGAGCLWDGTIHFPLSDEVDSVQAELEQPDTSDDSDDPSTTDVPSTVDVPLTVDDKTKLVSGDVQTRCDPADVESKQVQYLNGNDWQRFHVCDEACTQLPEFAACREENGHKYFVPVPARPARALRARGNFNTRCNPRSKSEVQRFNGEHWVHLYTCKSMESCKDIDGHGHCHAQSPAYVATKCSSNNESEIVEWNGRSWGFSGVCLPPYVCEDVSPGVEFAVCKHPNGRGDDIWLPWPYLASNGSSGVITRCAGPNELVQFNGKSWVPYRYCGHGFSCEPMKDTSGAQNGGCVAKGPEAVKKATAVHTRRAMAADEDSHHYEPFGFDHRSKVPEKLDTGLIKNTEKLVFQGEGLIQEGNDMVEYGNALYDSLYGSGSSQTKDKISPNQKSVSKDGSASGLRQRSEQGLVDDSVGMRHQGENLVREGNALVEQGRQLLRTIFGEDETDKVVNGLAESKDKSAKASAPGNTGTSTKPRGLDPSDSSDYQTALNAPCRRVCDCGAFPTEECDKQCRECIVLMSDATGGATKGKRSVLRDCVKECHCGTLDVACWANCHECTDEDRRIDPATEAQHACDQYCESCESLTGKNYQECWQKWRLRCHTCVMGELYAGYSSGLSSRGNNDRRGNPSIEARKDCRMFCYNCQGLYGDSYQECMDLWRSKCLSCWFSRTSSIQGIQRSGAD